MKRLLIAGLLAVGLLAAGQGRSEANGGFGFGMGLGLNFSFQGPYKTQTPTCGPGGPCCYPPGFSPFYCPPAMYGAYPFGGYPMNYPSFGGFDGAQPAPLGPPPPSPKVEPAHPPVANPLPVGK
ncbi:MAG: hypothetical protein U0736_07300 [Gemmataceae bacterium]